MAVFSSAVAGSLCVVLQVIYPEVTCVCIGAGFYLLYFLLIPKKTAAAPSPARSPTNGAGVDACC